MYRYLYLCCGMLIAAGCSEGDNNDGTSDASVPDVSVVVDAGGGSEGRALGAGCDDGLQCASTICAETPFGGICGECIDDTQCEWGCRPPSVVGLADASPSICDQGGLGARCQTGDACRAPLYCGRNPFTIPLGNDTSL
ncbi:MAG: hypothetical protein AAFV29_18665, partial [Myxococcota bacterium]